MVDVSTPMKVALLDPVAPEIEAGLRRAIENEGFVFETLAAVDRETRVPLLAEVDYAISFRRPLGPSDLPHGGRLRLIQRWGAGYDGIDVAGIGSRKVGFLRTAGANAIFVAEQALTLTLSALREIPLADRTLRVGRWESERHYKSSSTLIGKTVGLIGFGKIAKQFARFLEPFDGETLFYARSPKDTAGERARQVSLEELLTRSDVVSVHVPLSPETRGMIGAGELSSMKPTAVLINTARGEVVDEDALVDALRQHTIAAAGLDVFAHEPIAPDHPLLTLDNVVLAPHLGGKVRENVDGVIRHIARNLRAHASGLPLPPDDVVVAPR